jgi:hypothetical protein
MRRRITKRTEAAWQAVVKVSGVDLSYDASLAGCAAQPNPTLLESKALVLRSEAELWSKGKDGAPVKRDHK